MNDYRLSLRERTSFRGAKGDNAAVVSVPTPEPLQLVLNVPVKYNLTSSGGYLLMM